jgi:hypothetical protein
MTQNPKAVNVDNKVLKARHNWFGVLDFGVPAHAVETAAVVRQVSGFQAMP